MVCLVKLVGWVKGVLNRNWQQRWLTCCVLSSSAIILALVYASAAQAALSLELTQGKNAAMPIAVLPFAGQSVDAKQAASDGNNVAYIIAQDLQNSGQFYARAWADLKQADTKQFPSQLSQFRLPYWRRLGVDDVLLGQVRRSALGLYKISFALVGVYTNASTSAAQTAQAQTPAIIADTIIAKPSQLRQAAHHISDAVYQALLGVRGNFSTRIAYVNWYIGKRYDTVSKAYVPKYAWSLQLADADGYNAKTLLTSAWPIMSPAWSPDGHKLAYVSFENNQSQVYLQDLDTAKRRLLSQAAGVNGAPTFSPDGKQLALVLSISGHSKIYIMSLSSGKAHPMLATDSGATIDTEPNWSPDGRSIVFTSDRGGSPQLYRYDLNGSAAPVRLTFSGNYNAHGVFLPSGKQLVLMHRDPANTIFNIAKLNLANDNLYKLTDDVSSEAPTVAPNGQMVLYTTRYAGHSVLAEVAINGDVKLRLPLQLAASQWQQVAVKDPAWSPFLK